MIVKKPISSTSCMADYSFQSQAIKLFSKFLSISWVKLKTSATKARNNLASN